MFNKKKQSETVDMQNIMCPPFLNPIPYCPFGKVMTCLRFNG